MSTVSSQDATQSRPNRPIFKVAGLHGGVGAAVWRNTVQSVAGDPVEALSVTISMPRYKDPQDDWKTSRFLRPADLPGLIYALQRALDFCATTDSGLAQQTQDSQDVPF